MSNIKTEFDSGVFTITMDRPKKRNALTVQMYEDLITALKEAESDDKVRVTLIKGNKDAFTAGNDVLDFMSIQDDMKGDFHKTPVVRLLYLFVELKKPLVACVRGNAIGVGTTMLLHCDFVYASDTAKFNMPFVSLGVCPEGASSFLIPRVAGQRVAAELLMFAESFDGQRAVEAGIVNRVIPDDEIDAFVAERCARLCALPAASLRATKALLKASVTEDIKAAYARELPVFAERLSSPEAMEAFMAFAEKRKPDFSQFI